MNAEKLFNGLEKLTDVIEHLIARTEALEKRVAVLEKNQPFHLRPEAPSLPAWTRGWHS